MQYNYKQILEAINKGINLALDDFDDNDLIGQQTQTIKDTHYTKDHLNLINNFVDFGLPSGTLWCKYNLGCDFTLLNTHPEKTKLQNWIGDYYMWGEINPISYNIKKYDGYTDVYTKYNQDDQLAQLLPEDDVAYQNINFGNYHCYIPTMIQFQELIDFTSHKYVQNYCGIQGLNGVVFTEKYHNDELFFPTCGYYSMIAKEYSCMNNIYLQSSSRAYTKSTNDRVYAFRGMFSQFTKTFDIDIDWIQRICACPIRPVLKN